MKFMEIYGSPLRLIASSGLYPGLALAVPQKRVIMA